MVPDDPNDPVAFWRGMARVTFHDRRRDPLGSRARRRTHGDVRAFIGSCRDAAGDPDMATQRLFGETHLCAVILDLVRQHCATADRDALDSYAIGANACAMEELAQVGLIEITERVGRRVTARILPAASALQAHVAAEARVQRRREAAAYRADHPDIAAEQLALLYDLTLAEVADG